MDKQDCFRFNTIIGNRRKTYFFGDFKGIYNEVVLQQPAQIVPLGNYISIRCDYDVHHVQELHVALQAIIDIHLNNDIHPSHTYHTPVEKALTLSDVGETVSFLSMTPLTTPPGINVASSLSKVQPKADALPSFLTKADGDTPNIASTPDSVDQADNLALDKTSCNAALDSSDPSKDQDLSRQGSTHNSTSLQSNVLFGVTSMHAPDRSGAVDPNSRVPSEQSLTLQNTPDTI